MSFYWNPGQIRHPPIPNWTFPLGCWVGKDTDSGYYAFHDGHNGYWGGSYLMTQSLCYNLKVDNSTYYPVYSPINGYIWWASGSYIYYSIKYGWILCGRYPGYEPIEEYDYDKGEWTGDAFYSVYDFPQNDTDQCVLFPRGSNWGKAERTLTAEWKRWVSNSQFGKYEPQGGATGDRYLGLPRFRGSNSEYFTRSLAKSYGHYTYGRIRYVDGAWVIGTPGLDTGWHEGEEPSKDGSVTFRFTKPEGSEAEGRDITVSLHDYVRGDETGNALIGEVAIWR